MAADEGVLTVELEINLPAPAAGERLGGARRAAALCWCAGGRRASAYARAVAAVPLGGFRLTASRTLRWWRAAPRAERGCCGACGGFLFWRPDGGDSVDVAPGCLDGESGVVVGAHIRVSEAADYAVADGPPRHARGRAR